MQIQFIYRKPTSGQFSIERVFKPIEQYLKETNKVSSVFLPNFSSGLSNIWKNINSLKSNEFDINHVTGDVHYACLAFRKMNCVLTIHDVESIINSKGVKSYIKKILWFTWPLNRCAYITVISEFSKKELLKQVDIPAIRIKVIHNPLLEDFKFVEKLSLAEKPRLLHIGTKPNKNLNRLIEAIAGISVKLVVIGKLSSNQRLALQKQSIDFENFENLSNDEIIEQYKNSDIVSFISTYEGFGMPVIEAQAVGRPVLVSDIPSIREIAGDAVRFVNPLDVSSIRLGLIDLLENAWLRKELVEKGKKNIERFKIEVIGKQYEDLYKLILQERL